ncbi:MAG: hypothetical protein V3S40_07485 [Kiloniellales bacterium]
MNNRRDAVMQNKADESEDQKPKLPKVRSTRLIERVGIFGVGGAFLLVAAKGLVFENWFGIDPAMAYGTALDFGTAGVGFILGLVGSFIFAP